MSKCQLLHPIIWAIGREGFCRDTGLGDNASNQHLWLKRLAFYGINWEDIMSSVELLDGELWNMAEQNDPSWVRRSWSDCEAKSKEILRLKKNVELLSQEIHELNWKLRMNRTVQLARHMKDCSYPCRTLNPVDSGNLQRTLKMARRCI